MKYCGCKHSKELFGCLADVASMISEFETDVFIDPTIFDRIHDRVRETIDEHLEAEHVAETAFPTLRSDKCQST